MQELKNCCIVSEMLAYLKLILFRSAQSFLIQLCLFSGKYIMSQSMMSSKPVGSGNWIRKYLLTSFVMLNNHKSVEVRIIKIKVESRCMVFRYLAPWPSLWPVGSGLVVLAGLFKLKIKISWLTPNQLTKKISQLTPNQLIFLLI